MEQNKTVEQYSLLKIIFLSLFPGLIILLMAIIFSHPAFIFRFPILLSLMLAICFGLVPSELSILFFIARKDKKKLTNLIKFREKTPLPKFIILILVSFIIAGIAFGIVSNYEHPLWKIFNWIPDWFRLDKIRIEGSSFLIISAILNLVFNGFIGPFVEEIYFRGFLLPRI
jgi:membrane protease YdiL (CAAX protease family)